MVQAVNTLEKFWFVNIAAMSTNGVIGKDNKLPWRLREDLKTFTESIKNNILVMGRKTCESLPRKQNNQINYVLTNDKDFVKEGYETIASIDELLKVLPRSIPIYVIGGESLYRQFMKLGERDDIVVTHEVTIVDKIIEGDAHFPIDELALKKYMRMRTKSCTEACGTHWEKFIYYKN